MDDRNSTDVHILDSTDFRNDDKDCNADDIEADTVDAVGEYHDAVRLQC